MAKSFALAIGAVAVAAALALPARAAEPSAVDKLYADLAKMPQKDRAAKILEGAKKEGKFDALSANIGTEWDPHDQLWAKAYPDVKQAKIGLMSAQVAERFLTEESTGKHLTDLLQLSSADSPILIEKGYAASFPTPNLDMILPKYKGFTKIFPNDTFMPTSMTEHGIVYNYKEISPAQAPKGWFDLCKPEFKKKVGYDPIEDRLLIGFYTMLGEEKAKQLIQCIGANDPLLQEGHVARIQLMQAGDHPVSGDALIYLAERAAKQTPDKNVLKVVYSDAVLADAFGVIISKNAVHPYAAALYADFELTDVNQNFLYDRMRGPIGVKHPFMPDDAQIVTFGPIDQAIVMRLRTYWTENVLKKSAK
jgi:ABC-type Fe3+ transport system substrate-binding protein